ncbi:unnamed protein product [Moneuplotes crassus]|uniref:Uncharacterized protein n=1 Tax=Euplotes crassus TaxID=5936 RepID=A0AAD1X8W7_EUPCR|nr:unnamed protein product [Moneuplotes crassus]
MQILVNKRPSVKYGPTLKNTLSISKKFDKVRIRKKLQRNYNDEACCYYRCKCKICLLQAKNEYTVAPPENFFPPKHEISRSDVKIEYKNFLWMAEHLLSPHDRIHGCELLIPETYFFVKGRPKMMIKSDRNNFLTCIKVPEKLELTEIRKDLPQFCRNRRSTRKFSSDLNFNNRSREKNNDLISPKKTVEDEDKLYPHDYARIVYMPEKDKESLVQLLSEKALIKKFHIRKNDSFWKTVMIMQSVIPYEINSKKRTYKFHFRILPEGTVKRLDKIEFRCYSIFVKICFYVDTMYNYEVEEAEMEFLRDDDNRLWVIDIPKTKILHKKGFEESSAINGVTYCHPKGKDPELVMTKEDKPQFDQHEFESITAEMDRRIETLETNENEEEDGPSPFKKKYQAIFEIMMNQYSNLKQRYGFDEKSEAEDSSRVISKLSPATQAKKLRVRNLRSQKISFSKKRTKIRPLMKSMGHWGQNKLTPSTHSKVEFHRKKSNNFLVKRSIDTQSTKFGTIVPNFKDKKIWTPYNHKRKSLNFSNRRSSCFGQKRSQVAPSLGICSFPVKHFNVYS